MKRYFIHTFGCQMNVNDSLRMSEVLAKMSYEPTPVPENADLIILNTCSIREKAEDKMLSALGRYKPVKASRGALIGVGGCVAQQEKDRLIKKVPYLDFVFGPDNIARLPDIIGRVESERARVVETAFVDSEEYVFPRADPETSRGKVTEFVTVMKGCDNVCSFCIVPHTRGREVSRAFPDVLQEVDGLAKVGVREVTLIGQNVNSYLGGVSFAQLLLRCAEVPGIERVRFTTSHPHDLSDELIEAFRTQPKIAPHFHLPVQCGSDRILKMMRRDYTVEQYLERLRKLRDARPGIAVTTDIIVGFPGETEEDFEMTMKLTEQVRFDNQFSFIYSPRPKTGAALREKDWGPVEHEVKIARLERLQKLQRRISAETTAALVGTEVEVMVEGHSRYDAAKRFGRTPENRTVNFDGDAPAGAFVTVKVDRSTPNQLAGKQVAVLQLPTVEPLPVPRPDSPFHVVAEA
ncbi:tRNA (N6-isopentenyl adenosine(37)-C2)-methylthiotransferase MiaB [Myxococcus sp. MISCRS1]|uniref:tRNA (N6-isopentenyl adenosine(37)-C2)-methylthiotransferase MiaB n=1 Tax=Myxococcus TaxID=32 RepID=UPI001143075E|nr:MULTISPECIES: tRNA (N6-isopentenyl adenosine(37)-C2)-methylthiotransferase MiaB [Myxococcus]MBZ4397433.1 tRNA (N6-isopentenyl adenosine(37)-C2)-methylthiotransferase MiaB [Myxococcus sp. AS-1-15]MBZ4410597.1 tRNA (N6-isopentenyl adenosine(37)-C2)-methylthiotransferase MiaB [Myxococcus sp. XM-1-1-1]MCK8498204.1 tRNA (N6-isopentenyl adenosine(37)-C2)-methylthiotransferase MiaB [Myxococcus fulvus]MCY1003740.1 tRNA (N6-isopentenyl adenosine(37)-C2)-methylthiotransferase MiaB [Myxococcus sp. MISC